MTARTHPGLQRVTARFDGDTRSLTHDDHPALAEPCTAFAGEAFDTRVWATISPPGSR